MSGMTGQMLHGVEYVVVVGSPGDVVEMPTDGRVYMWENGAITIYARNPETSWMIIPPHRVLAIVGGEHG